MNIIWLPTATKQRQEMIGYIADHNTQAAVKMLDEVVRQSSLLHDQPDMGRIGKRRPNTRELVIVSTPYILVYRVRPRAQRIEILAMIHERQQ